MGQNTQEITRASNERPDEPRRRTRWVVVVFVLGVLVVGLFEMIREPGPESLREPGDLVEAPEPQLPTDPGPDAGVEEPEPIDFERFLYSDDSIVAYRSAMAGDGPFYDLGDAGHGGPFSPGDGEFAEDLAEEFLDAPSASYWSQPDLPFESGAEHADGMEYVRPMHAAWIFLTQPDHPDRDQFETELTALLLAHARDETLDFSDSSKYPPSFHGSAQNPIFEQAHWVTRLIKARDMLGRDVFTDDENAEIDQWFYGYANWIANWLQIEPFGRHLPGRLDRDYDQVAEHWYEDNSSVAYDGAPTLSRASRQYTNRHAAVASTMSLAANYLAHYGYDGSLASSPSYPDYSVEELLDHSRLFVEETLRFSVYPEGFQGDFGRASQDGSSPQTGWLYAVNVVANLLEIADYHAARGDMSVWEYGTTEGIGNTIGVPVAGGFEEKNLHFFAWSMSRYINDDWGRRFEGELLAEPEFFHDVIPAALAHRFAPDDELLEAAWKRSGMGFPDYAVDSASQGPYLAELGEGGKSIGVIEHALATPIDGS